MADKLGPFNYNLREFVIDEIALEGLQGIAFETLWRRLEVRTSTQFSEKMKEKWWNFIVNSKSFSAYKIPEPVQNIEIVDRFSIVHKETGYLLEPNFYFDGEYEYLPAKNDTGSCKHYDTRKNISEDIKDLPYKSVLAEYGEHLVLVASKEERWKALAPHLPLSYIEQIPQVNYCLLELIGRSRENGQMTTGKTNLIKMVKDSKILFYYRKSLQDLGLIKVSRVTQVCEGKVVKGLLLRLRRFHKAMVQTMPKSGMLRDLVDYLKEKPNYCDPTENIIKQGLMTPVQCKRYQKKTNTFNFEVINTPINPGQSTNPEIKLKVHKKLYMCLIGSSDESSESEDEATPLKCQYKIGVNLMRQAYERFLDAGKAGLTQHDLAQLVGVEFYVSRTICRVFKKKNIVREFFEYKGKQRLGRYIAIAATSKMYNTLAAEEEKFQKYLDEGKSTSLKRHSSSDSEPLSHKKKRKLSTNDERTDSLLENVTEVDKIVPCTDRKHRPNLKLSLRHIKYASGIVKILNERTFVSGYQTLSNIVAKEINETPMDTKAIKYFLQNMMGEGHIKVFKMKLPRYNHYSVIICAPHVQKTDPIILAKYHEIEARARTNRIRTNHLTDERSLSQYAFPRYVKVQKLHESLMNIVYFNDVKTESGNAPQIPQGFFSMKNLISELPIGVALGHISSEGVIDIAKFTIENSMHDKKVSEAPSELHKALLNSANLNSSLRTSLKILATFGLVQFVAEVSPSEASRISDNNLMINLFYLNKIAKIIDTTGVWPRSNKLEESEEKEFHFECFQDVQIFWSTVYNISINTTIEMPNRKKSVLIKTPTRTKEQAPLNDTGIRYGDGFGPCGYDSSYFMDMQRLWRAYISRSTSRQVKETKKKVQIPKLEIPKKPKIVRKRPTKKAQPVKPKLTVQSVRSGEKLKRKKVIEPALWTPAEDRLLMICKAALSIVSPISQPGCLQVRNLVAKDILTINDPRKTLKCCHSRALFIDSNSTLTHEKNWILNEVRRHSHLISRYEGLLKKLRTMYPANMTKCINDARVPMMELVWIMYHLLKSMSQKREIPSINFEEFNKKFIITPSSASKRVNAYRTPHNEVVVSTLKEAIMLTVMWSYNNTMSKDDGQIIYSYFKQFPEVVLRSAIEPLRKCGSIAAKDKILNSQMHVVDLNDIAHCSYRISANYQRKWACRLSSDFAESLVSLLNQNESGDPIKAGGETNCFLFELNSKGALELVALTVPVITGPSGSIMQDEQLSVIDIETNFRLKSGKLSWKNKSNGSTLGKIYKDIPVEIALENLSRRSLIPDPNTSKKENDIVSYLFQKGESGATFDELQESLKYDRKALIKNIRKLEAENQIRRVGYYENIVVHREHAKNWLMKLKNGSVIPLPWLTLESNIRSDIFFQWAGVVLNKAFECPGCSVAYLSEHCEFLTARGAQDICEVLQKCECVTLHSLKLKEASLFSDEYDVVSEMGAYNEYESPKNIIVLPVNDCLSKFSYIRKMIMLNN